VDTKRGVENRRTRVSQTTVVTKITEKHSVNISKKIENKDQQDFKGLLVIELVFDNCFDEAC